MLSMKLWWISVAESLCVVMPMVKSKEFLP